MNVLQHHPNDPHFTLARGGPEPSLDCLACAIFASFLGISDGGKGRGTCSGREGGAAGRERVSAPRAAETLLTPSSLIKKRPTP